MKGGKAVIIAAAILAAVLIAGIAAAKGSNIQFSKDGNTVIITGTTNLAAGNRLLVEVVEAQFTPSEKGNGTGFSGASGTVVVQQGSPLNTYRFNVDVSTFPTGTYIVTVKSLETSFQDSRELILPWNSVPTTSPTGTATPPPRRPDADQPATQATRATQATQAPQVSPTSAPLPGIISLCAIISAAFLLRNRR